MWSCQLKDLGYLAIAVDTSCGKPPESRPRSSAASTVHVSQAYKRTAEWVRQGFHIPGSLCPDLR